MQQTSGGGAFQSNFRRGYGPSCPHCQSLARMRSSRQVSRTVRENYCACTNLDCGCTFVSQTVVIRILSESNMPHPSVHLPIAPKRAPVTRRKAAPPANDNLVAANDVADPGELAEA